MEQNNRKEQGFAERSIYWYLTVVLKHKYPVYWLMIATLAFILAEGVLRVSGEERFLWTELFFAYFIMGGVPIGCLYSGMVLSSLTDTFSPLFRIEDGDFSSWLSQERRRMFGVRYWPMWATAISVNVLGTLTLVAAGLPFQSRELNLFLLVAIQPSFFLCGHAAYFLAMLLLLQYKLVRLSLAVPFLERCHRAVSALSSASYLLALFVMVEYLGLVIAIRLGPYSDSIYMIPWITGLAVTPIVSFSWGMYQVHVLQREIKLRHLESISSQLRSVFDEFESRPTLDNIERLARIADIQQRVEQTKEWPIAFETVVAFILAAAAAIGQLLASLSSLLELQVP